MLWTPIDIEAEETAQAIANASGSTVNVTYDEGAFVGRAFGEYGVSSNLGIEVGFFQTSGAGATYKIGTDSASEEYDIHGLDLSVVFKSPEGFFGKVGLHSSTIDGAATITEYSAEIYAHFINKVIEDYPSSIIVCGGGRKNNFLMKSFKQKINCTLIKIDNFNIDGDFIESQAFGYLAIRSYLKLPISFPKTTGCDKPCTGGVIVKNY